MTRVDTTGAETDRLLGRCMQQERLLAGQERAALAGALGISERRLEDYEAGRLGQIPADHI